ncbi:MAG: hypothetical protein AAGF31_13040 [Planctomycetota bacterium]
MPSALMILIFVVFLTLIIIGGIYAHKQEQKRIALLTEFANELGWQFSPDKDRTFDSQYPQFAAFRRGHSRYAHNILRGMTTITPEEGKPVELPICAGDYHYRVTSGSGKNRSTRTYRRSYLLIDSPIAGCDLAIRSEHFGDRMAAALGFDDIDFESVEFSDRFHVKSSDKRFAYDVIHPRMMEFLLDGPTPDLEIGDGVLCLFGNGSRWEPHEFQMRIDWVCQFFALWPRHVQRTS